MILQLPSFLNTSFVERAKCMRRIDVYFFGKKNLLTQWETKEKKLDRLFDEKTF